MCTPGSSSFLCRGADDVTGIDSKLRPDEQKSSLSGKKIIIRDEKEKCMLILNLEKFFNY